MKLGDPRLARQALDAAQLLSHTDLPRVLLSAEGMGGLDRRQILHLRDLLPGDCAQVVVYLRNPRDFLISSYKQRLKQGIC